MSKTKNNTKLKQTTDQINLLAQQLGMTLMAAAATFGMMELPNHPNSRVAVPNQPVLAFANVEDEYNNPIKREQQETGPQYISYSVSQRTPARSARH